MILFSVLSYNSPIHITLRRAQMTVFQVDNLSKVFHVQRKEPGLGGAVKALFLPKYEDKVAVDGISFSVKEGEMVGYIGVNGAGKSTTIKMLTGILAPSGGKAAPKPRSKASPMRRIAHSS